MIKSIINKLGHKAQSENKAATGVLRLTFDGAAGDRYTENLLSIVDTNNLIKEGILNQQPFMVTRFGASELKTVNNFIVQHVSDYNGFNDEILEEIFTHSGVFPKDSHVIEDFSREYIESSRQIDLIGVWHNRGEDFLINTLCPEAKRCRLRFLEPYFYEHPWSEALEGKRVLVIHPFETSIRKQYSKREILFADKRVLPEFELLTLKAVQSLSGADTRFKNWKEALENMKGSISCIEFDVAIIGAGAYGLPLASFIKQSGKVAIHLGGASQLLFGIKGKRWLEKEDFRHLFNDHWIFPLDEEKPEHGGKVDGVGPYWK
ncbi:MAG: hypothetical protein J5I50_01680 [Chitinophagaceae bacterium]|nr:hypothetical protein [Chitinophagaceae bacterium]